MRNKMFQRKTKILYQKKLGNGYFHCGLRAPDISRRAMPGQFLDIKLGDNGIPLLRRPFSIHRIAGPIVEVLYEVLGRGTEILSQKHPGEYLDIIGPLGNKFDLKKSEKSVKKGISILVAGGMGVAPLMFLAEELIQQRVSESKNKVFVLAGAKSGSRILCEKEFKQLGCKFQVATDDGSRGFKGKVTDLLAYSLSAIEYRLSTIFACGPKPMLSEISKICAKYNMPGQVSLEEHMACGIGACLGCAVKTKSGYQRVCMEGPVFDADEIIWE